MMELNIQGRKSEFRLPISTSDFSLRLRSPACFSSEDFVLRVAAGAEIGEQIENLVAIERVE